MTENELILRLKSVQEKNAQSMKVFEEKNQIINNNFKKIIALL